MLVTQGEEAFPRTKVLGKGAGVCGQGRELMFPLETMQNIRCGSRGHTARMVGGDL